MDWDKDSGAGEGHFRYRPLKGESPPQLRGRPRDEGPTNSSPLNRSLRQPPRGKEPSGQTQGVLPAPTHSHHHPLTHTPASPPLHADPPPPQTNDPGYLPPLEIKERKTQRPQLLSFNTTTSILYDFYHFEVADALSQEDRPSFSIRDSFSSRSSSSHSALFLGREPEGQRWREYSVTAEGEGFLKGSEKAVTSGKSREQMTKPPALIIIATSKMRESCQETRAT